MGIQFDRIVVAVPQLPAAVAEYRQLLGVPPCDVQLPGQRPAVWWDLGNTVIELQHAEVECPRVLGVVFSSPGEGAGDRPVANALGIDVHLCDGAMTAAARGAHPEARASEYTVDHVVLRTVDAEACIELFAGELGIRLALDKSAPQWGGRMLFFRAGKLTLEVIAARAAQADAEADAEGTAFWGLAYACPDLEQQVRTLQARGVAVSAVREGRKPGTRVATVKSHCLDIPTLLIQPAR